MPGVKHSLRDRLRSSPLAFGLIGRRGEHPDFDRRLLRRGDDLVIEGYPRSGNTFATMAFRMAQPRPMKIGNHFHAPAQILRAAQFGIPAMVVIRDPIPAALSFVVYHQGQLSAVRALEMYVAFHKPLLRRTEAFSLAPFEEVISDFGTSISRLNRKFGTNFAVFDGSAEMDRATKEAIEAKRVKRRSKRGDVQASAARRTTPSDEKEALKARYREVFETSELEPLRNQAQTCFAQLMEHHSKAA